MHEFLSDGVPFHVSKMQRDLNWWLSGQRQLRVINATAKLLREMESGGYITVQNLNSDKEPTDSLASGVFLTLKRRGALARPPKD